MTKTQAIIVTSVVVALAVAVVAWAFYADSKRRERTRVIDYLTQPNVEASFPDEVKNYGQK